MKSLKALDITILILKILTILALVFSLCLLAFFSYRLVEGFVSDWKKADNPAYHSGIGLYYFASFIVLLGVNIGVGALNGIGQLVSYFHKSCPNRRENQRFFGWCNVVPVANQILYVVLLVILGKIK